MYIWCIYLPFVAYVLGLPTVFHIFAHTVPVEERSRAFGYLVAAGSVGQTVAALVRMCIKPHISAICLIIAQAIKTRIACEVLIIVAPCYGVVHGCRCARIYNGK